MAPKPKTRINIMHDLDVAAKFFRWQGSTEAAGLIEAAIRSANYDWYTYLAMKHSPAEPSRALTEKAEAENG